MADVDEELEAVQSVFMDDVSIRKGDDRTDVHYMEADAPVVTLQLHAGYPNELPTIVVADKLSNLGLEEHLQQVLRAYQGSPLLLQLLDAVKNWVEAHPLAFTQPTAAAEDKLAQRESATRKTGKNRHEERSPRKKQTDSYYDPLNDSTTPTKRNKGKDKKTSQPEENEAAKKQRMRPATEVISRIQWDPDLPATDFTVGYLDRFTGIIEKPFDAFYWEDISTVGATVLAIPRHRIQYFKYKNEIVWDKRVQLDNFFGSRGQKTIQDIVSTTQDKVEQAPPAPKASEQEIFLEDEESPEELDAGDRSFHSDRNRPSHFVCIQVTDEVVRAQVQNIQEHVTKYTPQLKEGCHPPTSLHVTLCMLKLRNDQEKETAVQVLKRCQTQLISLLPRCTQLTFEGVDNFRSRLVYVKVCDEPALTKLVEFLLEQLQLAGIRTPGNHDQFTPHMTIVKLSRPLCREMHTNVINPSSYQPFLDAHVGKQAISSLTLCSIADSKQSDGFYHRVSTVSNSLLGLSPLIVGLVESRLGCLAERGYLTEYERDQLLLEISSAVESDNHEKFETVISELLLLNKEADTLEVTASQSTVVILRGLPGSGKSRLAKDCFERKNNPSQTVIISADDYFTKDGRYEFVPSLAHAAHQHCRQQLLEALTANKKLIVIDNTNTRLWEYQLYLYLSRVLGYKCHILEIPCPTANIVERFCRRNQHSVGLPVALNMFKRWEEDKRAFLVPPTIVYPLERPAQAPSFSLLSLCNDPLVAHLDHFKTSESLVAVYVGVFLSAESQWNLLCSFPPSHANLYASHVTVLFQPSRAQLSRVVVGKKVIIKVVGSSDNGRIQAVAVELPPKLTSVNKVPHITISTKEGVPPKLADSLLQSQVIRCSQSIVLEGVTGVVFREAAKEPQDGSSTSSSDVPETEKFVTVTTSSELKQLIPKTVFPELPQEDTMQQLQQETTVDSVGIFLGGNEVTKLFIFDFDGTLFMSPGPMEGRREYERLTRTKWLHKGWLGWSESLLPPLKVLPGPALPDYHAHHGYAGSLTVLLTGRMERTGRGVLTVMENAQLFPHKVILKPDITDLSTASFKMKAVKQLLKEFPGVTLVKFWDDLPENLAAIQRLSQSTPETTQFDIIDANNLMNGSPLLKKTSSSTRSSLLTHLASYGLLPSREYKTAAHEGLEFLSIQFAQLIGYTGHPSDVVYPFGSYPLGRRSDVDLCLLAPDSASPIEWITRLSAQLESCGIKHVHVGHSSRCPRLTVLLQFTEAPAVEFDIVIAILGEDVFKDSMLGTLSASQVAKMRKSGDSQSKAALTGPLFLMKVKQAIGDHLTVEQFGAVVEMTVQLLIAKREKGNAFSSIRTFHIVQLLADFIQSYSSAFSADPDLDSVMLSFVVHIAELTLDKWTALLGDTVPEEYIPGLMRVFREASGVLTEENGHPSSSCYLELLQRTEFPPKDHTTVDIRLSGSDDLLKWKARTVTEARLPTYIRQLLSLGLHVAREGNVGNTNQLRFAVPSLKSARETLQTVLRPFWNELSDYRKKEGLQIQLNFGQPSQSEVTNASAGTKNSSSFVDRVHFFASSADKELHLPSSLSSRERLLVHEAAERLGLQHTTVSSGREKHIILKKSIQ